MKTILPGSIIARITLAVLALAIPACEQAEDEALARKRMVLLEEENARLVALVAKLEPAVAQPTRIENGKSAPQNVERLAAANERLRTVYKAHEQRRSEAFGVAERARIEREVEAIRGLKFKRPVDYAVLDRKDIRAALMKRMDAVFSPDEFEAQSRAMARLGFVPEGFELREKLISLLGEQVAAFYDQHEHKLYMYSDATLEKSSNRTVLSHELMHAMQDQHFSIKKLPLEEKHNDDRALAASALIEGEAVLVMNEYSMSRPSASMVLESLGEFFVQNMDELARAPRILRESLLFPYVQGAVFCQAGYFDEGWDALTRAYNDPPRSTAQILHPEKYWVKREEPLTVQWPAVKLRDRLPEVDNVIGELGVRILFTDWLDAATAVKAGEGWRGDRFLSFDAGSSLVWKTVWSGDADATEFFKAAQATLAKRYKLDPPAAGGDRRWESGSPRALRLIRTGTQEVVLIDAPEAETARLLEEQFAR